MDNRCTHHDALEFPHGETVLLTHLREGQHATVLQLPALAATPLTKEIQASPVKEVQARPIEVE
jgi:hypothetical protein